jgi:hypothetical protein
MLILTIPDAAQSYNVPHRVLYQYARRHQQAFGWHQSAPGAAITIDVMSEGFTSWLERYRATGGRPGRAPVTPTTRQQAYNQRYYQRKAAHRRAAGQPDEFSRISHNSSKLVPKTLDNTTGV